MRRACGSSVYASGAICLFLFFFFNDPAPPEIYTLSLHDALPILIVAPPTAARARPEEAVGAAELEPDLVYASFEHGPVAQDRKSTRLNSSHRCISYAVFCLKKKTKKMKTQDSGIAGASKSTYWQA